jgi:DNA modification methylase
MSNWAQLSLWPDARTQDKRSRVDQTTTFNDNMKLPVHRWFRFSAGFSAEWVQLVIRDTIPPQRDTNLNDSTVLFDPFAGSGTSLLAGETIGIRSLGIEAHPFVLRTASAKLCWNASVYDFRGLARCMLNEAQNSQTNVETEYPSLIHKCYPDDILSELDSLKRAWERYADGSEVSELAWLALTSILRISSPVGTSHMELIQPKKRKQNTLRPFDAFSFQVDLMGKDMLYRQEFVRESKAIIYRGDARTCEPIVANSVDLVVTSPPYANNFDYADATRLEMTFWNEVQGWKDLQGKVRKYLIRSCSQHVSAEKAELTELLGDPNLAPILNELEPICNKLEQERLQHGGRKKYHLMIAAYFSDLAKVWKALRQVCKRNSSVCFVIGDSAPYGIYVPVDKWLGELALAAGFNNYAFEKTRDRNVKWRNRKHKVPLKEGRLWVEG